MISLQRSMHSSQMYTPGPAMSFFTCFCDLPQNEHFRRSESPNLAMISPSPGPNQAPILRGSRRGGSKFRLHFSRCEDLVDDAVLLGLLSRHDEVAVGVVLHLLDGLAGVLGEQLVQELAVPQDLLGLDLDVDGLALRAAVGLVDEHPRVRQREALAARAGRQQHRRRRRGLAHHDGRDVAPDELHRVVDGEQRRDVAARRVDVEVDVLVGILRLEVQELRHDQVGHLVLDRRPQEDDALLEQARVDVERSLAAVRLLDDDGNEVVLHVAHPLSPCEEVSVAPTVSADSVSSLSGCCSTPTTSASSTSRSSALVLMISPASCVTAPVRSSWRATSLGSRPTACASSTPRAESSSGVTLISSCRATASRTRSPSSARTAWARASLRNRSSSHPWDSRTCSRVMPMRSARSVADCTRCSTSWSTRRSGRSTSTRSISAASTRSRSTSCPSRSFTAWSCVRMSSRSSCIVSNSDAVLANSSFASGSNLDFTS